MCTLIQVSRGVWTTTPALFTQLCWWTATRRCFNAAGHHLGQLPGWYLVLATIPLTLLATIIVVKNVGSRMPSRNDQQPRVALEKGGAHEVECCFFFSELNSCSMPSNVLLRTPPKREMNLCTCRLIPVFLGLMFSPCLLARCLRFGGGRARALTVAVKEHVAQ